MKFRFPSYFSSKLLHWVTFFRPQSCSKRGASKQGNIPHACIGWHGVLCHLPKTSPQPRETISLDFDLYSSRHIDAASPSTRHDGCLRNETPKFSWNADYCSLSKHHRWGKAGAIADRIQELKPWYDRLFEMVVLQFIFWVAVFIFLGAAKGLRQLMVCLCVVIAQASSADPLTEKTFLISRVARLFSWVGYLVARLDLSCTLHRLKTLSACSLDPAITEYKVHAALLKCFPACQSDFTKLWYFWLPNWNESKFKKTDEMRAIWESKQNLPLKRARGFWVQGINLHLVRCLSSRAWLHAPLGLVSLHRLGHFDGQHRTMHHYFCITV